MEKSSRFSEYLFAKMAPASGPEAGEGAQLPRNTTVDSSAPKELTGIQKWLSENMLLMVTLSGVLMGIILGKYRFFFFYIFWFYGIFDKGGGFVGCNTHLGVNDRVAGNALYAFSRCVCM